MPAPTTRSGIVSNSPPIQSQPQGILHALGAGTGALVWNRTFEGYNALAPAVDGDTLYLAGAFSTLYAFAAKTGEPRHTAVRVPPLVVTICRQRFRLCRIRLGRNPPRS